MRVKHLFYTLMATAGLLLSTACSNEDELSRGYGNEALVSFNVDLSGGMQTKTISDGKIAKQLTVHVFDANGDHLSSLNKTATFDDQLKANVTINLVKGKTYSFLFWAAAQNSPYTIGADGKTITVSYANATANDESRDAFLGVEKEIKVDGSFEQNVTLKRPFAQLNFLTDDIDAAKAAGLEITNTTQSSITISNAATTLDPFTNTVSGEQDVTFAAASIPGESETYTINGTSYRYLGTTYFLVNAAGTNVDDGKKQATLSSANLKINGAQGDGLTVNNVPAQWNYRTNIYGSLLTATGKFNVTIEPDFDQPDANTKVAVATVDQVDEAIKNGATDIVVSEAPAQEASIIIPKQFEANNTQKISLTIPQSNQKITIKYDEQTNSAPKEVAITAPTTSELEINLPQSTVTLNEGAYTAVTATTAANTLIIPEGVEVGTLTVNGGNVEIHGTVKTLKRGSGYADTVTVYVTQKLMFTRGVGSFKANKVILMTDVTLDKDVRGDISLKPELSTLDLNNHTLTAKSLTVKSKGSVIIKNGSINIHDTNTTKAIYLYGQEAKSLTLENVTLTANQIKTAAVYCKNYSNQTASNSTVNITNSTINALGSTAVGVLMEGTGTKLTVSGSTINHKYFGITQNGTYPGAIIYLTDTKIVGPYSGIYLSNQANGGKNVLNVDGCTISSETHTPIEVKKTDITVKNSTLISKATTQEYELNSGAATGVGYGVALAGYVAGTPYEGTTLFENNTFNLSAGEGVIRILKYNGTEGVDFEKSQQPVQ